MVAVLNNWKENSKPKMVPITERLLLWNGMLLG